MCRPRVDRTHLLDQRKVSHGRGRKKKERREELKPGSVQAHLARTPLSPHLRPATSPEAVAVCSPSEHEVACTCTLAC